MWPQCMRERPLEGPRRTSGKGTQLLESGTAGEGSGNRTEPRVHPRLPSRPSRAPAHRRPLQDARPGCAAPRPRPAGPPDTTSPAAPRGRGSGEDRRPAGESQGARMPLGGGPGRPPAGRRSPSTDPSQRVVKGSCSCRGQRSRRRGRPLLIPTAPVSLPGPAVVGEAVRDPEATLTGGREVKAGEGGFRVNRDETDTKRRPPGTETAGGGLSTHSGSSLPLSSSESCFSLVFPKLARAKI